MIKLSDFAKENGICYKTAHNKFREGEIKGIDDGVESRVYVAERGIRGKNAAHAPFGHPQEHGFEVT